MRKDDLTAGGKYPVTFTFPARLGGLWTFAAWPVASTVAGSGAWPLAWRSSTACMFALLLAILFTLSLVHLITCKLVKLLHFPCGFAFGVKLGDGLAVRRRVAVGGALIQHHGADGEPEPPGCLPRLLVPLPLYRGGVDEDKGSRIAR